MPHEVGAFGLFSAGSQLLQRDLVHSWCSLYECVLSRFSRVQLSATFWNVAHQAPLSMGFSRQEYWSVLLCPSPGDLPDPGIKPESPAAPPLVGGFFTTSAT